MKSKFKQISSIVLICIILVLTACSSNSGSTDEIQIGLSTAMTGNFPLAGERTKQGVELAVKEINANGGVNGKKIKLVIEDDQNTQTTAVNVVTKLVNSGVVAVIGPHTSGNVAAVSDIYKNAKIPFITGGASPKLTALGNPYLFRARPSDTISGKVAATYAVETLGAKKVGISFNNNDFGTGGRDVIKATLEQLGIPYVEAGHNSGDKDLTGQLMQLKSAGVDLIISWTDDAEVALTSRQLYELNIKVPVIASAGVVMDQVLNLVEPEYVENWYSVTDFVSSNSRQEVVDFVKNFNDEYGIDPELYASTYYSAMYVLADAIERASETTPEKIREALTKTSELSLPEGVYTADANGDMLHESIIVQIKSKKSVVLDIVRLGD